MIVWHNFRTNWIFDGVMCVCAQLVSDLKSYLTVEGEGMEVIEHTEQSARLCFEVSLSPVNWPASRFPSQCESSAFYSYSSCHH